MLRAAGGSDLFRACRMSSLLSVSRSSTHAILLRSVVTSSQPIDGSPGVENQRKILHRCVELQSYLQPINDRLRGPLEKSSDKAPMLPFVFLLGNHSSGKSSFINYVLGRQVQTAGVAPTDDSFTIIAPGPSDIDQDGPALIGDPDMGFSGLRHFGPDLIHHTQLKIRDRIATESFMLVDSPGMIDSPVNQAEHAIGTMKSITGRHLDRGYDFEGVCKWFADRADVILLFFDPDKPGTTAETVSILTKSLTGMDHKLYIILNKADQFTKMHDFARSYGSLCWNLSKVIPRKDLPRIYTMYLPVQYQRKDGQHVSMDAVNADEAPSLGQGLIDLEKSRDEVVGEVMKAPKRRIDNVITRLADSVHLVQMHGQILEAVRSDFGKKLWAYRASAAGLMTMGAGMIGGGMYFGLTIQPLMAISAMYGIGTAGFLWYNGRILAEQEEAMASPEGLRRAFERLYSRPVLEGDEFITSLWKRTFQPLRIAVETQGLADLPKVTKAELNEMQRILDKEIPSLRRLAAPVQWTYKKEGASSKGSGSSPSSSTSTFSPSSFFEKKTIAAPSATTSAASSSPSRLSFAPSVDADRSKKEEEHKTSGMKPSYDHVVPTIINYTGSNAAVGRGDKVPSPHSL